MALDDEKLTREVLQQANMHMFYICGGEILPFAWGLSLEAAEAIVLDDSAGSREALMWLSNIVELCKVSADIKHRLLPVMYGSRAKELWEQRPDAVRARIVDNLAALAG